MNSDPKAYAVLKPFVETLLEKRKVAKAERAKIDKIQRQVLQENRYCDEEGERILEPSKSYKIVDASHFYQTLHDIYIGLGYELKDVGYCPALIAESEVTKAENELLKQAEPLTKIPHDKILSVKQHEEYIGLLIKMVGCLASA